MRAVLLALTVSASLLAGCKQHGAVNEEGAILSAEESATVAQLTRELRRTMVRQRLSGSFEEFAAARSDMTIPPPPAGKKYAISKKWTVVVVDR